MAQNAHPVDEFLPVPKLLTLGLQHVLVMYAGAVAVPLILGRALKLKTTGDVSSCRILVMSFLAWNSRRPVSIS